MKSIKILLSTLLVVPFTSYAAIDPEHVALVDTGFDACVQIGGVHCEENKNLLFRGGQPLPDDPPFIFNFDHFRNNIFSYLTVFKKAYVTHAALPNSVDDLKSYRIVVINLLYDFNEGGDQTELLELENEFKESKQVASLQLPEQHKMYGLETAFNPDQYAFEWWPMTFALLEETDPQYVNMHMNWPSKMAIPMHSFEPQVYKALDFPYFITGITYADNDEKEAKDLRTLLNTIPEDGHPLLIFYHCVAGKDRTGAVSAAYFMKHGGYPYVAGAENLKAQYRVGPTSLTQALEYTIVANRHPNDGSVKLSKAYCLTLGKALAECK